MILNIFIRFFVFILILGVLIFPQDVIIAGKLATELSFFKVLPSLFPFFVLQTLALKVGLSDIFSKILRPLKLFKMSNISPFILGIIGGYPIGAKSVYETYKSGELTKINAENALGFCNNAGPAFIVGFVGAVLFNSKEIGLILLFSHIFSAMLVGFLFSFSIKTSHYSKIIIRKEEKFLETFIDTIKNSFNSSLMVCGFIIFFGVLVEILIKFNVFYSISLFINTFFFVNKDAVTATLIGLIELTSGINFLVNLNISLELKLILTSFLLSFGGLSIHLQTLLFIKELNSKKYFIGKILASFISPILCIFLYRLLYSQHLTTIICDFALNLFAYLFAFFTNFFIIIFH